MAMHDTTAAAAGPIARRLDHNSQPSRPVADPFDVDVGEPDKEFAHARRIGLQQGLPNRLTLDTNRLAEPLCRARDRLRDQAELTPKSEAPERNSASTALAQLQQLHLASTDG